MDEAFDNAENADRNLVKDHGWVGVVDGLEVVEDGTPDLTVTINAGVAYDQDGQRCSVAAPAMLDLSVDSSAVSTTVANPGNAKWLSVFIEFDRALSDPRVDGNGSPLQYKRGESYQLIVEQGAEVAEGLPAVYTSNNVETFALTDGMTLVVSVNGRSPQTATFNTGDFASIGAATAAEVAAVIQADIDGVTAADDGGGAVEITTTHTGPGASVVVIGGSAAFQFDFPTAAAVGSGGPAKPALKANAILLADVLLRNSTTAIYNFPDQGGSAGFIDVDSRRETAFNFTGAFNIKTGTIGDFANDLASILNTHIANAGNAHPADAITYVNSGALAAANVQDALDELEAEKGSLAGFNNWSNDNMFTGPVIFENNARFEEDFAWSDTSQPFTRAIFTGTAPVAREHFMFQEQQVIGGFTATQELVKLHTVTGTLDPDLSRVVLIEGDFVIWQNNVQDSFRSNHFWIVASIDGNATPNPTGTIQSVFTTNITAAGSPVDVGSFAAVFTTANPAAGSSTVRLTCTVNSALTYNFACNWTVTEMRIAQ